MRVITEQFALPRQAPAFDTGAQPGHAMTGESMSSIVFHIVERLR
jgi:hypothetical protein